MKFFPLIVITLFLSLFGCAQPKQTYSIKDKRAIKAYEEAIGSYNLRYLEDAQVQLEKLVKDSPNFIEAHYMLAQVYDDQNQTSKAIVPLKAALAINPEFYPAGWMMLAECYFAEGNYVEAEQAITKFMPYPKENATQEKRAMLILSSCVFAKEALQHPMPFNPVNMGEGVNTETDEYYPCITADFQTLLYTRMVKDATNRQGYQEDFFISQYKDGKWQPSTPVLEINTPQNEGAPTLSADGQTLIFTACEVDGEWGKDRTGIASCDLFFTIKSGNGWSPAKNLGTMVNTGVWESQPSFSADGKTLYFVRGRNVGRGIQEQDIYYSVLNSEQKWTKAEKIPGKVNTIFEESSVMIHPDGRTLYFSSNGHSGMGGMDIYMSRMLPDGSWDKPINLGYPINTAGQEDSFQVTADGTFALFSSTREGGFGKADLYSFDMPESIRPKQVSYVKGVVSDKLSYKKLEAHLELIDLETGKVVVESYSNAGNGEFLVCLPTGKDYALNVSRSGYIFHSENFSLKNYTSLKPYQLDIKLQKLRPGSSIVLNNVFFETNSFDLKPESKIELDKLAELMKLNPAMKFELGGHTDNVGADENNLTLSQNRANNVVKYLVSKGIPADKLVAVGYGESKPVDTNDTEEGRKKNRRTEFKILE
jgi:outer membrane protein OmpA-like peptidoglycan-associated protein/Tol biopolymer transport system component